MPFVVSPDSISEYFKLQQLTEEYRSSDLKRAGFSWTNYLQDFMTQNPLCNIPLELPEGMIDLYRELHP